MHRGRLVHELVLSESVGPPTGLRDDVTDWITEVDGLPAIRAHKYAEQLDDGGFAGIGIGRRIPYPADAVAACAEGRDHPSPDVNCGCGFYALQDHRRLGARTGAVELEVLLAGRVHVHDSMNGLLAVAARQHVITVIDRPAERDLGDPVRDPRRAAQIARHRGPGDGWDPGGVGAYRSPPPGTGSGGARLQIPVQHLASWRADATVVAPASLADAQLATHRSDTQRRQRPVLQLEVANRADADAMGRLT